MTNKANISPDKCVTVRMYNVGFGDSFLLFFPERHGRRAKMLIDCGTHRQSKSPPPIEGVVTQIVADATENGVPKIDVVVATHRHEDHVLGFKSKQWSKVQVKEVWMPWTEHPTDQEAKEIREAQSKSAARVKKMAEMRFRLSLTREEKEAAERASALASNNLTNKAAMDTLHIGFSPQPKLAERRYFPKAEGGETFESKIIEGLKVHVMGPSRKRDVISNMENSKEEYLAMMNLGAISSSNARSPFRGEWRMERGKFKKAAGCGPLALSKKDICYIEALGNMDVFAAASSVEGAVNGTSLMMMFEIGQAFMLFPGDAQWGTWDAALKNPTWRSLLEKTTFYKIGHHGSHNATPISFVEKCLQADISAMVCTGPTAQWTKSIPKTELIDALRKKSTNIARSDKSEPGEPAIFRRNGVTNVDLDIPI
jgi:beta-lactamase superfamily II metal-dependent hydrolase